MNTLLGEVATLNDVQFPRYRIAFKFRKLQKTFMLEQLDMSVLQEALQAVGVRQMGRDEQITPSLLQTFLAELYSSLRLRHPVLSGALLRQAQELCFSWLQMALRSSSGVPSVRVGALKLALGLLSGSKASDKAKFMFNLLANDNGVVEKDGIKYFCKVTQQLATSFQETVFTVSVEAILLQCLALVRSAEDVEDDEYLDGAIQRHWLSQFEFVKVFSAMPLPAFLSWLELWDQLPALEKLVHPVRCAICTRKPIVSLRYQCSQCPSFHLCQMCFLKGRTTDKHPLSHKVLEFSTPAKAHRSWHHRLLGGSKGVAAGGKVMSEPRQPFTFDAKLVNGSSNDSIDVIDAPMTSINAMLSSSQQISTGPLPPDKAHKPFIIRIGSDGSTSSAPDASKPGRSSPPKDSAAVSPRKEASRESVSPRKDSGRAGSSPRRDASPLCSSPARRISCNSSPESVASSTGGKFPFEAPPLHSSSSSGDVSAAREVPRPPSPVMYRTAPRRLRTTASESTVLESQARDTEEARKAQRKLSDINKRLSMEVDMLLNDLPPPPPSLVPLSVPRGQPLSGSLQKLQVEEQALQSQVSQLTNKREKLAHELSDLMSQVQSMHVGFVGLSNGVRAPSTHSLNTVPTPLHVRMGSAPSNTLPLPRPSSKMAEASSISQLPRMATPPDAALELLDPLVDFTPEMNTLSPNWVENQRFSVAW